MSPPPPPVNPYLGLGIRPYGSELVVSRGMMLQWKTVREHILQEAFDGYFESCKHKRGAFHHLTMTSHKYYSEVH